MVLKLKRDAVGLFGLATVQLLKRRQEEVEQSKSQQARQQAWRAGGAAVHQVDRMCVFMCVCVRACQSGESCRGQVDAGAACWGLRAPSRWMLRE